VLYPAAGGTNKISVSGSTSGIETCCDYVKIYNGVGTGGTLLGTYTGSVPIPASGVLTSTAANGTLTIQFHSDGSVTGAGFTLTATGGGSSQGNPSVIPSGKWTTYVWGAGDANGGSGAWTTNYSGYYDMTTTSFDSRIGQTFSNTQSWDPNTTPSNATGYVGCPVTIDNHSYTFKRQGLGTSTF